MEKPLVNVYITMEIRYPPFLMGKSTISMAIFNSYVSHYQRLPPVIIYFSTVVGFFPCKPAIGYWGTPIISGNP